MFFALCVTVLNDVGTLSPSADVRINLLERQLFDFVFALTEFPIQLGVCRQDHSCERTLWVLKLKVTNSIPLNRFGEVGAGCWRDGEYSH